MNADELRMLANACGESAESERQEERAVQLATRPGGDLLPALFMLTDHGNVYAKYGTNRWQRIRLPWEEAADA